MRYLLIIFTLLWTVLAHSQTAGQLQMDQWDGTNWRALTVTPGTSGQMLTWGASNTITSTTLTKTLIGLSAVENTALSTWPGSTSITTLATVANPSWLTSLPWSKITSAPSFITGNQTITISGAISGSGTTSISTVLGSNQARDNLTGGTGSLNLSGFTLTLSSSYPTATPTKGHILVGNGTAWLPLTVGTNTHVLTADSVESLGVKWAAAAGGSGGSGSYDATITSLSLLAAKATVALPANTLLTVIISAEMQDWQLIAGSNATSTGIQRPNDYNASTNIKVWFRRR
jgi:hypothetical protein